MTGFGATLTAIAMLGTAVWIAVHVRALRAVLKLPVLTGTQPPEPAAWPRVSLIVAACDEEATIEGAVQTLLSQDYPDLEIILVDDRSRDGTRAIIDRIAARDARVRAVHIDELPEGWLGKVHALHTGTLHASGEWLLFCDADVHLAPGCLRRAVAHAVTRGLDHLPVLPRMIARSVLLEATYCAFGIAFLSALRASALADPSSAAYAGVGAFNLVRADTLNRGGGLSELRMEVADDVGVGFLVKRAGGRSSLVVGGGALEVEWYRSVGEMASGLEKNLFGVVGHYRLGRAMVRTLGFGAVALAPVFALLLPLASFAWVGSLAAGAVLLAGAWIMSQRLGQRHLSVALEPLGVVLLTYMICRSAIATLRRGGIVWRGTFYSLAELRAGQRVKV